MIRVALDKVLLQRRRLHRLEGFVLWETEHIGVLRTRCKLHFAALILSVKDADAFRMADLLMLCIPVVIRSMHPCEVVEAKDFLIVDHATYLQEETLLAKYEYPAAVLQDAPKMWKKPLPLCAFPLLVLPPRLVSVTLTRHEHIVWRINDDQANGSVGQMFDSIEAIIVDQQDVFCNVNWMLRQRTHLLLLF